MGQQRPVQQNRDADARIRKFQGVGRQCLVKTPVYNTSVPKSPTKEQDWMQIWVQYDTEQDWTDEVVLQYFVLAKRVEQGRELFSLYRKVVKYPDVPKGRGHAGTVFLRPNTLRRYGEVVAAAVELSINGEVVDFRSEAGMKLPSERWWSDPAVTGSAAVTVRDGYLLDRSETPFRFVNIDDFEASR